MGKPGLSSSARIAAAVMVAVAAGLLGFLLLARPAEGQSEQTIVLERTITDADTGRYLYLPFEMPDGVRQVSVELEKTPDTSATGLGIFDQRGPQYGSPGFRGIYGEEDQKFFIEPDDASVAFVPGRIDPGRWTIIVPVFRGPATGAERVTVTVRLSFGDAARPAGPGEDREKISSRGGWYRGDLHDHTTHSSDGRNSQSALTPRKFIAASRRAGLDFVSLTDHNVTTQNRNLRSVGRGQRVLAIPGVEMTNWFHGHATVTGLEPGDWLDWRQRPRPLPLLGGEEGVPDAEARIDEFIEATEDRDVYTAAAHPSAPSIDWDFFQEAEARPELLPDGLEVWTGPFQPDDQASIDRWDELLNRARDDRRFRIVANGASDVHGFDNTQGFALGHPTTVAYGHDLSKPEIVEALEAGRSFISCLPDGPELYLEATVNAPEAPEQPGEPEEPEQRQPKQRQVMGGTVYGDPETTARVSVTVRGGKGRTLFLVRDGVQVEATPITGNHQEVRVDQPVGAGGFVRAELRGDASLDPTNPVAGEAGMEAMTNPIFLERGRVPDGFGRSKVPIPEGGKRARACPGPPEDGGIEEPF